MRFHFPVKINWKVAATFLVVQFFVIPCSFAQKRADLNLAAAQALTRFEFGLAFKLATEASKLNPQNFETRKMGAKAAKELQKFAECLKFMAYITQPNAAIKASTEDVHLVGECASGAQFPSWTLSFLTQQNANIVNHDAAAYWLGKHHYRRSDYTKALEFLNTVNLVPARLEKDRQFMMDRSKEVVSSLPAQPKQSVTQPSKTDQVVGNSGGTPSSLGPSGSQNNSSNGGNHQAQNPDSQSANESSGWVLRTNGKAELQGFYTKGNSIQIGPSQQTAYKNQLDTKKPGEAIQKIEVTEFKKPGIEASALAEFGTYYPWSSVTGELKSLAANQWGAKVFVGLSQSTQSVELQQARYVTPGSSIHSSLDPYQPQKGWVAGVGTLLHFRPFKNLRFEWDLNPSVSSPLWKGVVSEVPSSLALRLGLLPLELSLGTKGVLYFGKNRQFGAWSNETFLNLTTQKIGFVSLDNEADFPTFRWTKFRPKGSNLVVNYTAMEGDFYELNIAPRIHLSEAIDLVVWYRFVTSARQSYVGPGDKDAVEGQANKSGDWELFRPTAEYSATSSDYILQANWNANRTLKAYARVSVRRSINQYFEDKNSVDNLNYAGLLDRSGDDWFKFGVGLRTEF